MIDNKANKRRNIGIFQVCLTQLSTIYPLLFYGLFVD